MTESSRKREQAIGSGFEEQALEGLSELQILRRLTGYMRPYWAWFAVSLALIPVVTGLHVLEPHLLQLAIDDHLVPGQPDGLGTIAALYGFAVVGRAVAAFAQRWLMQVAGLRALRDLRQAAFDHVQTLSVSFFHRSPVGRLMSRITTDVESIHDALASGIVTMAADILTLSVIVVVLLSKDWKLALVSFTVAPPLIALTALFRHYMRRAFREIRVKIGRLYAHLQESITGMEVIQLFVRENVSSQEYDAINEDHRNANFLAIGADASLFALVDTVGTIAVAVIIWYGSGQVLQEAVTLGALVAFIEYMQRFFVPIRDLAQKYNMLQVAVTAAERVFGLLDTDERLPQDGGAPPPEGAFDVEFDDVWFAYQGEDWVLKGVSFRVEAGEKVAFVGHTGAGKTTIMSLLLRLYDVQKGVIRVNGRDVRDYDLQALRRSFAVVRQDVFLFSGTAADNIALGKPVSHADVVRATEIAGLPRISPRWNEPQNHQIAERGGNLSAGEKQLLAFARAVAHDPHALILDEATANVDTETERLVQETMEFLMQRQTSLIVAHRLSTIQKANRIVVLDKGAVAEVGSHEELVARGGVYEKLYRLQHAA